MASLIRNPFGQPIMMRKAYGDVLVELGQARRPIRLNLAQIQVQRASTLFSMRNDLPVLAMGMILTRNPSGLRSITDCAADC